MTDHDRVRVARWRRLQRLQRKLEQAFARTGVCGRCGAPLDAAKPISATTLADPASGAVRAS